VHDQLTMLPKFTSPAEVGSTKKTRKGAQVSSTTIL
jgi:hypothetical protein